MEWFWLSNFGSLNSLSILKSWNIESLGAYFYTLSHTNKERFVFIKFFGDALEVVKSWYLEVGLVEFLLNLVKYWLLYDKFNVGRLMIKRSENGPKKELKKNNCKSSWSNYKISKVDSDQGRIN